MFKWVGSSLYSTLLLSIGLFPEVEQSSCFFSLHLTEQAPKSRAALFSHNQTTKTMQEDLVLSIYS